MHMEHNDRVQHATNNYGSEFTESNARFLKTVSRPTDVSRSGHSVAKYQNHQDTVPSLDGLTSNSHLRGDGEA
jgi:hypothetical protein